MTGQQHYCILHLYEMTLHKNFHLFVCKEQKEKEIVAILNVLFC